MKGKMEYWRSHSCTTRQKQIDVQPSSSSSCLIGGESAQAPPPGAVDAAGVLHPSSSGWTIESPMPMAVQLLDSAVHSNNMENIRHQDIHDNISRNDEVAMQAALEATLNQQQMVQAVLQVKHVLAAAAN